MSHSLRPKISVVTACINSKDDLKATIDSVHQQDYLAKEHIIIDGASADGTNEMLKSLKLGHVSWISEPDQGISDAFNKGVRLASGDYLFFLGAGDKFIHSEVLSKLFNRLSDRPMLVCGKVQRVSEQGKPLWVAPKKWPKPFHPKALLKKLILPHQGLFMHRDYFTEFGDFALDCKFAMDYELLLRSYHRFPSVVLVDDVIASWQAGGIGQGRIFEIYDEYHRIKTKHQVASPFTLKAIDSWNRVKVSLKKAVGAA